MVWLSPSKGQSFQPVRDIKNETTSAAKRPFLMVLCFLFITLKIIFSIAFSF